MNKNGGLILGLALGLVVAVGISGYFGLAYFRSMAAEKLEMSAREMLSLTEGHPVNGSADVEQRLPLSDLELPAAILKSLANAGMVTIGDLTQNTAEDLTAIPGIDRPAVQLIREKLELRDLSLKRPFAAAP